MTSLALSHGIFEPNDLEILQKVFDRICAEPWFTVRTEERRKFARYLMHMYMRGLILPDRLDALCRLVAYERFSRRRGMTDISGQRFLVVEDEYMIAMEAKEKLNESGAEVVGPVANVNDALQILKSQDIMLDGALLDIALDGQMVYPVAASLRMKRIPFAFVTGYEGRQVPAIYRRVPTFAKPADWAAVAASLADSKTHGAMRRPAHHKH
ncbi:hypothetical protein PH562_01195 [Rhizobium sp. CNPSo 4062]|uniref:hypothetical protein n=1 Tax=Rhizobium sp. CNPSo 4062 TaxID=3021410 RepID=UPI00254DF2FE|nr:hypothetical protein [Rhizobium sp. CNPSo 4062]MDK4700834.1 hypothetical protein [Rhizobium sp. CNPSo 4062]